MKKIALIFIIILVSSCCGKQKVIESKPIENTDFPIVTEVPDIVEVTTVPEPPIIEEVENVEVEIILDHDTTFEYFNHSIWKDLLKNNVSENGHVNYKGFKVEAQKLRAYIDSLSDNMPTSEWPKNDKLAYWINTYNALTVDLILRNYPTKSIKDIKDPWDQRLWKFGDKWYNLNDIEHKILRKMNEPRIHFAIVCASVSCPKLQNEAFTASNLEEQLTNATKEFLADASKNELTENNIKLSKIFKWFKKDFEQNRSLIDFFNQYSEVSISNGAKKNYKDYNWDLND